MAKYLKKIIARFERQEQKGLNKYGQILEDNPRGYIAALEYLAEELTDGLMYVQEAIVKLKLDTYRTSPKETELQSRRAEELIIKLENEIDALHKENNAHQQYIQDLLTERVTYREDDIYPLLAGRVIELQTAGEFKEAKHWNEAALQVLTMLKRGGACD
jgi:hypothetical protein